MGLIIPKCNAHPKTLEIALGIYYEKNDWVENAQLINILSQKLGEAGIEESIKEPQSYTKKTQVLSYYGLLEWEDPSNTRSRRRITLEGQKLYEALGDDNLEKRQRLLLRLLSSNTFGRNVLGCDSDSDLEAPNIFLKSCMLIKNLTNKEFAYILGQMEFQNLDLADALLDIVVMRKQNKVVQLDGRTRKWADPKPILALADWGILTTENRGNSKVYNLEEGLLDKFAEQIANLRIRNTYSNRSNGDSTTATDISSSNLQIIYFGTPGSGKSHKVQQSLEKVVDENVFRTTFHPDSDYASFVGCYKPTMEDEEIKYEFTPQVFTEAYVQAWKKQEEASEQGLEEAEKVYLVIEEINRGNCAQIFGDLFQLLDRNEDGSSTYKIRADKDLANYLQKELGENHEGIAGGNLQLPANLHLTATMNTSDQSLFPLDSAFKRRWDWEYVPIDYSESVDSAKFEISIEDRKYSWIDFLKAVNERILKATDSEDKQMGNFFIKHSVDEKEFKSKVMFYLWHEVCKEEYHTKNNFFRYIQEKEEKEFSFNELHEGNGTKRLVGFMEYLGIKHLEEQLIQDGNPDSTDTNIGNSKA